jgi:probable F420-dependent oxidoreductase
VSNLNPKPFRFGVVGGGASAADFAQCALSAERLGYSVFLSPDHLDLGGSHFVSFAAIPALSYAAAVTTDIRLGTSVINHDLHHPAVLAREVASLDVLSNGRFELGLGAGWAEYEYNWAGIKFDEPKVRVSRFEEYVQVVKSILTSEVASFEGEYFKVDSMPGIPRPLQSPGPPILIGGTGKRMITAAVREADIVGVNLNAVIAGTAERMDERIGWIREAAGDDLERIEINNIVGMLVVDDGDREEVLARELARQKEEGLDFLIAGMTDQEVMESPITLIGSVDVLTAEIEEWRRRWGISYIIVTFPMMEQFAPVVQRLTGR